MLTKLTLSIDDEVISKAKTYANRKKRSISKIVEEYLKNLAREESDSTGGFPPIGKITKSLSGRLKGKYSGESYEDLLVSALQEKHQ